MYRSSSRQMKVAAVVGTMITTFLISCGTDPEAGSSEPADGSGATSSSGASSGSTSSGGTSSGGTSSGGTSSGATSSSGGASSGGATTWNYVPAAHVGNAKTRLIVAKKHRSVALKPGDSGMYALYVAAAAK